MRKLWVAAIVGAMSLAAIMAAPAMAATEFGDNCPANEGEPNATLFEVSALGNPLPTAAPAAGIITKWKVNVIPVPVSLPQTLKVLRPNSATKTAQVVGEASQTVVGGPNVFETRISVQAGDRIAIFGSSEIGTLVCTAPGEIGTIGGFLGSGGGVGSTVSYVEVPAEARIPVSAVIEPDADNDGYGDETQDKCPQSASFQGECPKVKIDIGSVVKKKGSVVVALTATNEASVNVTGAVKLGKGKKAKLSGGKKTVKPGKITRFTLKFPAKLKAALGQLSHSQSLSLKITASAKDLIGRITKDQVKAKLKGQG
jgi:hypothetical protein